MRKTGMAINGVIICLVIILIGLLLAIAHQEGHADGYKAGYRSGKQATLLDLRADATMSYLTCIEGSCEAERLAFEKARDTTLPE